MVYRVTQPRSIKPGSTFAAGKLYLWYKKRRTKGVSPHWTKRVSPLQGDFGRLVAASLYLVGNRTAVCHDTPINLRWEKAADHAATKHQKTMHDMTHHAHVFTSKQGGCPSEIFPHGPPADGFHRRAIFSFVSRFCSADLCTCAAMDVTPNLYL